MIKVIAQLKERWTEDKNDRKSRRSVSLFVSPTADHVAIAFRSQITFLCKDNNYQMPTGTFNSKSDLWNMADNIAKILGSNENEA